ncbi:MAG: hypothetical protein ACXVP0_09950 [Bacteroidia bacterium]
MPIRKVYATVLLSAVLVVLFGAFILAPKDPLDKKIFLVNWIEVKDGNMGKKALPDEMEFKDGKLFSNVLNDKFSYKWIKYRINKDSVYIDENESEIRYYEVEASHTDDMDQTMTMICKIDDYDIEGEVKITKKDKLKKNLVFNGKEKYKKPKKEKDK